MPSPRSANASCRARCADQSRASLQWFSPILARLLHMHASRHEINICYLFMYNTVNSVMNAWLYHQMGTYMVHVFIKCLPTAFVKNRLSSGDHISPAFSLAASSLPLIELGFEYFWRISVTSSTYKIHMLVLSIYNCTWWIISHFGISTAHAHDLTYFVT